MLTFEMNAGNFDTYLGGGTADCTRVTGDGVQLDLCEHANDDDTLGLWHLHDEVWTDASGHGVDLTPVNGATLSPDGMEAARASSQYATVTDDSLNLRAIGATEVTLECWFRLASLPGDGEEWGLCCQSTTTHISVARSGATYSLKGRFKEYLANNLWLSHDFTPVVGQLYAVRLTWKRTVGAWLYLDGAQVDENLAANGSGPATNSGLFRVGMLAASGSYFDGLLDEVRLSKTLRSAGAYEPKRHLPSGTFTSPAFDTERLDSEWLALAWQAQTPGTTGLAMHVRSGDSLDGGGQVTGQWQPADGTPEPGRYLQWRGTLARSTDALGLLTPTVETVTAVASEAGYNLYAGAGQQARDIDYGTPLARLGPGAVSHSASGLAYPAVHWFGLRSTNADGLESRMIDAEVRLELDADGQAVPARPAPVESLEAAGAGGAGAGKVRLQWLALAEAGEAAPDVFRVYSNGGSGEVDFNSPVGEVACVEDLRQYEWTSEAFDDGLTVTFAVRAETDAGGVDGDPAEVGIEIDAAPPAAVGFLAATPTLDD